MLKTNLVLRQYPPRKSVLFLFHSKSTMKKCKYMIISQSLMRRGNRLLGPEAISNTISWLSQFLLSFQVELINKFTSLNSLIQSSGRIRTNTTLNDVMRGSISLLSPSK